MALQETTLFPFDERRKIILRQLGILVGPQNATDIRVVQELRGGEGFIYVLSITDLGLNGTAQTKRIVEKHIVTMGGSATQRAYSEVSRLHLLGMAGVAVPHVYGVQDGALYRNYIEGEDALSALDRLRRDATPIGREKLKHAVSELSQVARVLDSLGFSSTNFVSDLVYNPVEQRFYQVDGGFDLGEPTGIPTTRARTELLQSFPHHTAIIDQSYRPIDTPLKAS